MGVVAHELDYYVRHRIASEAAADGVFAFLGEPAAPHEATQSALHSLYELQCSFLAMRQRIVAWFPGVGGGSTFAAALFVANVLLADAHANVLIVTVNSRACDALDAILMELVDDRERERVMLHDAMEPFDELEDEAFTHAIVDYHPSTPFVDAIDVATWLTRSTVGVVRFVGSPMAKARRFITQLATDDGAT